MARAYINPAIVKWAIDASGFSTAEIAKAIGIAPKELSKKLADKEDLSFGQLTALRKKLRRPSATFYLSEPPADIEDVAHRVGPENVHTIRPPKERIAIRQSKRIQNQLRDILTAARLNLEPVPQYSTNENPREIAGEITRWMGNPQFRGESPAKSFRNLRALLGKHRVFVLLHSFGEDGARGFSLQDDLAPIIGINTKLWSHGVRSYTAVHELGHIITRSSSSCSVTWTQKELPHDKVERWCEEFASEFLMPLDQMQALVPRLESLGVAAKATRVSNVFHVSRQAAFLRLIELNLASWDDYREYYVVNRDQKGGGAASPDDERRTRAVNVRDMLGQSALEVVHLGIVNELTTQLEIERLLNVSQDEIAQFTDEPSFENLA